MYTKYTKIAHVQRVHGRTGEVVAVPAHGLNCMLTPQMPVAVVPPDAKASRYLTLAEAHPLGAQGAYLLRFEHITSIQDAERLVGKFILVESARIPKHVRSHVAPMIVGSALKSQSGQDLGTIQSILSSPAQEVWEILHPDGHIWMLPVVDEFVLEQPDEHTYIVSPPPGLIEGV